jgi:hypothetical protein
MVQCTDFDTVEYIRKLRNAGATQEVAEVQAQEMEHFAHNIVKQTNIAFDNKDIVTKGDLDKVKLELQREIAEASGKTILWVSSIMGIFGVFFLGILAKGFHWI